MPAITSYKRFTFRNQGRCSAFATIMALMLVTLVGAAVLLLTLLLTSDVRRTQSESADAQLRQLLSAGAMTANHQLSQAGNAPHAWDVDLPANLSASAKLHVALSIEPTITPRHRADIRATLNGRSMRQSIVFERSADRWVALSASLNDWAQ